MDRDREFLRSSVRPSHEEGRRALRVVDLFAGCGGLTLGLAEAARQLGWAIDVPLAVDFDAAPVAVFQHNFPKANVVQGLVEHWFGGELGTPHTTVEANLSSEVGQIDVLVGGPPCQGHSDLNNHTRREDPKNALYLRMARAAEVLNPSIVIIENVPTVVRDRGDVVGITRDALREAEYEVALKTVDLHALGVPQRRKRHVLLAVRDGLADPELVMGDLSRIQEPRDLRWAIGDLEEAVDLGLNAPSRVSDENQRRIDWLFQNEAFDLPNELRPACHRGDHSYVSMYGRLAWDQPAQTITSGYSSMGQGRYVHPAQKRTLTPHEAARIQFFPDWFDFTAGGLETRRGAWATMVANAVPPKLTLELGRLLLPQLPE